jgi:hypothetical protein
MCIPIENGGIRFFRIEFSLVLEALDGFTLREPQDKP